MESKRFSDEFKEQVLKECQETGNVALLVRRHGISSNTVHTWRKAVRKRGSVKQFPKESNKRQKATEKKL